MAFKLNTKLSTEHWTIPAWTAKGVFHGFGTKSFDDAFSREGRRLLLLSQVHGTQIISLTGSHNLASKVSAWLAEPPEADGWFGSRAELAEAGVVLGIKTADCFPVLLYDPQSELVCALHCGWRSAVSGLLGKGLELMRSGGAELSSTEIAIGPGAQDSCYEIGADVAEIFRNRAQEITFGGSNAGKPVVEERNGKLYGNLQALLRLEADSAEIARERVFLSGICTICDTSFFSYRRQKSEAGRQVSFIG